VRLPGARRDHGPGRPRSCTALSAGIVAQQMANDPEGDRWLRRVDDVVDMFLLHLAARSRRAARLAKGTK